MLGLQTLREINELWPNTHFFPKAKKNNYLISRTGLATLKWSTSKVTPPSGFLNKLEHYYPKWLSSRKN